MCLSVSWFRIAFIFQEIVYIISNLKVPTFSHKNCVVFDKILINVTLLEQNRSCHLSWIYVRL